MYPQKRLSRAHKKARRTAGDLTLNSTAWANVDTALDLSLRASAGDEVEVAINAFVASEAVNAYFDVATIVSAAPVNSFERQGAVVTTPAGIGLPAWCVPASAFGAIGAPVLYVLQTGDIDAATGQVTLRLRYATSAATNKTLRASATIPLSWWAKVLGPPAS